VSRPRALALVVPFLLIATAQAQSPDQRAELNSLRAAAEAKTKEIGKLAQSGQLPTSDEALKLLQQMVDELKQIRERLNALEEKVSGNQKATDRAIQAVSRVRWGGYLQYQYQDTDRLGFSQFDAFRFRRVRIGLEADVSPRLAGRVSFDLATGTNQTQEQLRDAWIVYDVSGGAKLGRDRAYFGQMALPLGYELERSSADRELPERSQYNQILFPTERSRGVKIRREGRDGLFQAAVMNALTINDPEQANLAPGPGNKLAGMAQARYVKGNTSVGASYFGGDRPDYAAGGAVSPEVKRQFAYLDFEQRAFLLPRLTIRGELMRGNDRLPSATAAVDKVDRPMAGYHLMGAYQLSSLDRLAFRWEHFDPNLDAGGNALHGLGLAYIRELTPQSRVTFAHEIFVDQARASTFGQTRYGLTTLRLQLRF